MLHSYFITVTKWRANDSASSCFKEGNYVGRRFCVELWISSVVLMMSNVGFVVSKGDLRCRRKVQFDTHIIIKLQILRRAAGLAT